MASSGRVRIYFEASPEPVVAAAQKAESALSRFTRGVSQHSVTAGKATTTSERFGRATSTLGTKLRSAAGYAAGAAAAYLSISQAKAAITTTQELTKATLSLHKNLGLSNKQAGEWSAVARARGADTTKLGMAFKTLSTQVESARSGSATAQDMFKQLGLTMNDLNKGSKDVSGLMLQVSDGIDKLGAGTARTNVESKLFGRSWQTLVPVLRDGSAVLKDNLAASEKWGAALHGPVLKGQEAFRSSTLDTKLAWEGLQNTFTEAVTPSLMDAEKQFQHIATIMHDPKLTSAEKWQKVSTIISDDLTTAMNTIVKIIPTVAQHAGEEAPKIAGALLKGFLNSDVWGKLALGTWFLTKIGLTGGLMKAAGKRIAAQLGIGIVAGEATGAAGGVAAGGATGVGAAGGMGLGAAAAISAAPFVAIAAAMKGIDETGLLDAGGPISKTPIGGLLGIGAHSMTEEAGAMRDVAVAIGDIKSQTKSLAEVAPKDLNTVQKGLNALDDVGASVDANQGRLIKHLLDRYGTFANAGRNMSRAQKNAWIDFATTAEQNGQITLGTLQKLTDGFDHSSQKWKNNMQAVAKVTGDSMSKVKSVVGDMNVKVSKDFSGLVQVTGGGMTTLASNVDDLLGKLGVKQSINFVASKASTGPGNFGHHANRQRGGPIPGYQTGDIVPAMLEPGEFVLNRNAVDAIGPDLLDLINGSVPRFAKGGSVAGNFAGMQPAITALAKTFLSRFGGVMSSGLRPGDPGFHGRGLAADIVPSNWGGATAYANQIGSQLLEGIHQGPPGSNVSWDSGSQVPPSFWGAATWAEHVSHIHLATQNAIGAAVTKLARIILKGPAGPLRSMGQASLDKSWHAANAYLAKKSASLSAAGMSSGISIDGPVQAAFAKVARKLSTSKTATLALGEAGYAESGMQDLAGGDASSSGSLQLLASTAAGMGINPHDEGAVASAFLLRGFYGKGGANKLAAQGLPAYMVAQDVQGSAFSSGSNYAAQEGPAKAWMQRYGLQRGGRVGMARGGPIGHLGQLHHRRSELADLLDRLGKIKDPEHPKQLRHREQRIQEHEDHIKELITEIRGLRKETHQQNQDARAARKYDKHEITRALTDLLNDQLGARGLVQGRTAGNGTPNRFAVAGSF